MNEDATLAVVPTPDDAEQDYLNAFLQFAASHIIGQVHAIRDALATHDATNPGLTAVVPVDDVFLRIALPLIAREMAARGLVATTPGFAAGVFVDGRIAQPRPPAEVIKMVHDKQRERAYRAAILAAPPSSAIN